LAAARTLRQDRTIGSIRTRDSSFGQNLARGCRCRRQERHAAPLLAAQRKGLSFHLVKNSQLAEDLVSEVFLDIWRSARSFKGKSQVSTWLLSIARHKAFSALRRRCDEQLDDGALAMVEDPRDDPETLMDKEHLRVIVRKCLAQLSPAHREVLDLVYYHDKSIDEIAEIVGIPATTVKTRAFYARSHMEKFLKSAGGAAV
jgi:RNA polymerase sigma-70 factor, ECF subfamily